MRCPLDRVERPACLTVGTSDTSRLMSPMAVRAIHHLSLDPSLRQAMSWSFVDREDVPKQTIWRIPGGASLGVRSGDPSTASVVRLVYRGGKAAYAEDIVMCGRKRPRMPTIHNCVHLTPADRARSSRDAHRWRAPYLNVAVMCLTRRNMAVGSACRNLSPASSAAPVGGVGFAIRRRFALKSRQDVK